MNAATGMHPRYDQLPCLGESDVRHAWDYWGAADRLGTLNHITPATVLRALALPQRGVPFSLSLPLDRPDPPLYDRAPFSHRIFDRNHNMVEDELQHLDPQASSQWDSLRHIRAGRAGHYLGLPPDDRAVPELGIHQLAEFGLVARGLLVDVPEVFRREGRELDALSGQAITADDLRSAFDILGLDPEPGDLLLLRTGWVRAEREHALTPQLRAMPPSTGLEASAATAALLWDLDLAAVAADNPAVENLPGVASIGSLHRRLIPAFGMPLGELWDLDALATDCSETGRYTVCVVSAPLNLRGGVASPANAFAIV